MKGRIAVIFAVMGSITASSVPVAAQDAELELALEAIQSTPPIPPAYLPENGTYHSAQHPFDWPPFPANMHGLAAWDLGDGFFLLDDGLFDYEAMSELMAAAGFSFGGPMMSTSSYSTNYTTNDLWLEINGMTNGCTGWTADLTIHRPLGETNPAAYYDVLYAPTLEAPTPWEFLMRVPTNIIAQTNIYARYLCEERGFFLLSQTNGTLVVDTNVTAQALAEMLVPPGVEVANAVYTGHVAARGVFSNANDCGLPIESGVILSSGPISYAVGTNDNSGGNLPDSSMGTSGDPDLSSLVGGGTTLDAAVLEFDVYSSNSVTLTFQYFFTSEEYPEWIDQFNDPMAIFVTTNRVGNVWTNTPANNIALVPCVSEFVGIGTINGGSLEDIIAATNGLYYLDNNDPDPLANAVAPYAMDESVFDFQYDGMTILLLAEVEIEAGVTNRVKLAVADFGGTSADRNYDSAVFIKCWTSDRCQ